MTGGRQCSASAGLEGVEVSGEAGNDWTPGALSFVKRLKARARATRLDTTALGLITSCLVI